VMTKEQAWKLVTMIAAAWTRPPMAEETFAIYVEHLSRLDYEVGVQAVNRAIATRTFLPSIAEINELAGIVALGDGTLSAEEAWGVVLLCFDQVGSYREFPRNTAGGEVLKKTVDLIGWMNLCRSENQAADRAHFFRIYEAVLGRERHARVLGITPPDLRLGLRAERALPQVEDIRGLTKDDPIPVGDVLRELRGEPHEGDDNGH